MQRLEDLGPGDLVQLECGCGRTVVLTPAMLRTAGVEPAERRRCRSNGNGKSSGLIRGREIAAGAVNHASLKATVWSGSRFRRLGTNLVYDSIIN
jgi:hypothetical protein